MGSEMGIRDRIGGDRQVEIDRWGRWKQIGGDRQVEIDRWRQAGGDRQVEIDR